MSDGEEDRRCFLTTPVVHTVRLWILPVLLKTLRMDTISFTLLSSIPTYHTNHDRNCKDNQARMGEELREDSWLLQRNTIICNSPIKTQQISLQNKVNFFERRVGEYGKSGVGVPTGNHEFSLDADF